MRRSHHLDPHRTRSKHAHTRAPLAASHRGWSGSGPLGRRTHRSIAASPSANAAALPRHQRGLRRRWHTAASTLQRRLRRALQPAPASAVDDGWAVQPLPQSPPGRHQRATSRAAGSRSRPRSVQASAHGRRGPSAAHPSRPAARLPRRASTRRTSGRPRPPSAGRRCSQRRRRRHHQRSRRHIVGTIAGRTRPRQVRPAERPRSRCGRRTGTAASRDRIGADADSNASDGSDDSPLPRRTPASSADLPSPTAGRQDRHGGRGDHALHADRDRWRDAVQMVRHRPSRRPDLATATGEVTGTPTATGVVNVTATVTDADAATDDSDFTITVNPAGVRHPDRRHPGHRRGHAARRAHRHHRGCRHRGSTRPAASTASSSRPRDR